MLNKSHVEAKKKKKIVLMCQISLRYASSTNLISSRCGCDLPKRKKKKFIDCGLAFGFSLFFFFQSTVVVKTCVTTIICSYNDS